MTRNIHKFAPPCRVGRACWEREGRTEEDTKHPPPACLMGATDAGRLGGILSTYIISKTHDSTNLHSLKQLTAEG